MMIQLGFLCTMYGQIWSTCMLQGSETIQLLGLEDMAATISTMSPLNLLGSPSVKPVVSRHMPSHFRVSAATFFENKHGKF